MFQFSNFPVIKHSIWLSGFCLSGYLAYLAFWLSGWTIPSGWLYPLVALFLFPPVALPSTCSSSYFHLLIPLNPLVASLGPTQYSLNYINMHEIRQHLYNWVVPDWSITNFPSIFKRISYFSQIKKNLYQFFPTHS